MKFDHNMIRSRFGTEHAGSVIKRHRIMWYFSNLLAFSFWIWWIYFVLVLNRFFPGSFSSNFAQIDLRLNLRTCVTFYAHAGYFAPDWAQFFRTALLLLGGELLAERCRTDDLVPSISFLCLPPCRVDPEILYCTALQSINQPIKCCNMLSDVIILICPLQHLSD